MTWPRPMHERSLKTRLESPEFKAVREGHAGACATQVPLWRQAANSCSRRLSIGSRPPHSSRAFLKSTRRIFNEIPATLLHSRLELRHRKARRPAPPGRDGRTRQAGKRLRARPAKSDSPTHPQSPSGRGHAGMPSLRSLPSTWPFQQGARITVLAISNTTSYALPDNHTNASCCVAGVTKPSSGLQIPTASAAGIFQDARA